jgi:hypothetical protein
VRLKAGWEIQYKQWRQRDLSTKRYVYWWADGIYYNVGLDEERSLARGQKFVEEQLTETASGRNQRFGPTITGALRLLRSRNKQPTLSF